MPNLIDYGFRPSMMPENADGIPARVTAVHRDRYTLYCEHGEISGRLKAGVYYEGRPGGIPDGRRFCPDAGQSRRRQPDLRHPAPPDFLFTARSHPRPQGTGGRGQF